MSAITSSEPHTHLPSLVELGWPVMGLALALGGLAQWLVDDRSSLGLAVPAYLIAAAAYAVSARRWTVHRRAETTSMAWQTHPGYLRWAVAMALVGVLILGNNRFHLVGVACWLLAMLYCLLATPVEGAGEALLVRWRRWLALRCWRVSWPVVGLIVALCLGAWMRFHRLAVLPADLGWDLPYNFSDAQRILRGETLIFFPDNYGREGMFFYLIAAVAKVGGLSAYSIRVTSALVGVATIPAAYLLARECADEETASYAALLLAVNKWHITLTRSGYRVSLMPLFSLLALYGLARALRRGRARDWALTGLWLGLGLWTYKAFLFMVPTALGIVGLMALLRRRQGSPSEHHWGGPPRQLLRGVALMLLALALAFTPMIRFLIDSPETYLARELLGAQLVGKSVEGAETSRLALLARNTLTSVLMFHYEGDANSRFGVPFQRHLGYVSGVLLVFGAVGALAALRRGANALLLASIVGLMVPMTISMLAGEKPNCFRSSGVIGPALVLGAVALRAVRSAASSALARLPSSLALAFGREGAPIRWLSLPVPGILLPFALCAGLILAESGETERAYFHDFRDIAPDTANYSISLELARRIIAFEDGATYIKSWPYWYDGRAVQEHLAAAGVGWSGETFQLEPDLPPLVGFQGKMLVLLHPQDRESLEMLQDFFPRHTVLVDHDPRGGIPLVAFYGER